MLTLLQAMARQEGFYASGTRPARNNNPGDIVYGLFAEEHGAINSDGRYAIFPSPEFGFAAMRALLLEDYAGLTVEQALNKWAPPVENETSIYVRNVCEWCGCKPTDLIDSLLGT